MDLLTAKHILNTCERTELQDHAFGDKEVTWKNDGMLVAEGYMGRNTTRVYMTDETSFKDDEAKSLMECGTLVEVQRNDVVGTSEESGEGVRHNVFDQEKNK